MNEKKKMSSLLFPSCMSLFLLLNTKEDTYIVGFFFIRKSMGQCLVTNILQNIFFCVWQKEETHTGLAYKLRASK